MQILIEEINKLLNQNAYSKSKENNVNIFNILGVEHKEVRMCRFLAWLINPKESHKCGDLFLKSFMEKVIGQTLVDSENVVVETEYPIDVNQTEGNRRIDIVIYNRNFFIPIEVKIYADDQESQCYDYYHFVNERYPNSKIYYLTRYGDNPSSYSLTGKVDGELLSLENVGCISFRNDIWEWLNELECDDSLVKALIKNYKDSIADFTGRYEMETSTILDSYICNDPQKFKEALNVANCVDNFKVKITTKIFSEFMDKMSKLSKTYRLDGSGNNIAALNEKIYKYHVNRATIWPGLKYVFSDIKLEEDICLGFIIEIGDCLYCGLRPINVKNHSIEKVKEGYAEIVEKYIDISHFNKAGWVVAWAYLPSGHIEPDDIKNINSRSCNDNFIALVDDNARKVCIEQSVEYIEKVWLKPINSHRLG